MSVYCTFVHLSVFSLPDDNFSKCQWIFTKLGVCIDMWTSDLGVLTELSARDTFVFSFPNDNFSKYQWVFTKLGVRIDIIEIWFGNADGQILTELFARNMSVFSHTRASTHTHTHI